MRYLNLPPFREFFINFSHRIHTSCLRGAATIGGVAQVVEPENHNLWVRGSSPFAATKKK